MSEILLDANQTLVVAILAYFLGRFLTGKIEVLDRFRIPEAVTGGMVVAVVVALLRSWGSITLSFTMGELALLTFFTTIGLNARMSDLRAGGTILVLTLLMCAVSVVVQNLIGLGYARIFDAPPAAGIMAGSVALVGGHGTAAAWAPLFEKSAAMAGTIGLASATFGLVAGGILGSPLGRFLIIRNDLSPVRTAKGGATVSGAEESKAGIDVPQFLASVLTIAIAIGIGGELNTLLQYLGLKLPQFVTSLFAGIVIGNLGPVAMPRLRWPMHSLSLKLIAELSLSIFLVRALMSLKLWTLASVAGPLLTVLLTQVAVVLLLAYLLFRLLKRNYDAAIITSGFVGLSLGATPTAVANMDALSSKFGPSSTAFLVIPLVGAFFIDLINAFVVSTLYNLIGG